MTRLVQVITGPMEGHSFLIVEDQTLSLGRSTSNDVTFLYDPWISSTHLTLKNLEGRILLTDQDSSNGTYVNGDKVEPFAPVPVEEYFVLGSTLCRTSKPGPMLTFQPVSSQKDSFDVYRKHPLVREALREAQRRRSPVLSTLHLFASLIESGNEDVHRYLYSLDLNPVMLSADLEKYHIFSADDQWLNDFLPYQFRSKKKTDCQVTPQVQHLLQINADQPYKPIIFLKSLLQERYNILFPLLGITGEAPPPPKDVTKKKTLTPYDSGIEDLTLPGDFWSDFETTLMKHPVLLVSGDKGTGKTAVLEQCFHQLPKVNISAFSEGNKRIFDPEMFLVHHEVTDLVPYINTIIKALREEQTIGIDHFGRLLHLMHQFNIEDTPLLRVLNRRKHPTILAVGSDHLPRVQQVLKEPGLITMDQRVREQNTEVLDSFLRDFEAETKKTLSAKAEAYLVELLTRYNFTASKAFLDFCTDRLRNLNYFYKELKPLGGRGELSEAFFRAMYDRWSGTLDSITGSKRDSEMDSMDLSLSSVFDTTDKSKQDVSTAMATRLEDMLNDLLARNFRTAVTYSDGSRGVAETGELTVEQRADELMQQMEFTGAAFRSGFVHWLKLFLKDIDPAELRVQVGREPPVLWDEYVSRFEAFDVRHVRNRYLDIARKVFLKRRKEGKRTPPDSLA